MALADKVSDSWIAFARTGDPNQPKLPHWPAFNVAERPVMVLSSTALLEKSRLRPSDVVARCAP